jgi:hypothetical protein
MVQTVCVEPFEVQRVSTNKQVSLVGKGISAAKALHPTLRQGSDGSSDDAAL